MTCRLKEHTSRRKFLHRIGQLAAGILGYQLLPVRSLFSSDGPVIGVVKSADHIKALRPAVEMLGSMKNFVSKGDNVLLKPNISWDRRPEQAANTNPELVREVIKMCFEAGAKTVKVLDRSCNNATRCYDRSGIAVAAREAGADVSFVSESRFTDTPIPEGKSLRSWPLYRDFLRADKFISMPVLKHHSMAVCSGAVKNAMGLIGGDRGTIHRGFPDKIVDINSVVKPHFTILDATRVLIRNGPQGGSLDDVQVFDTIITGIDVVAVDSVGATLMGNSATEMPYLLKATERGLGEHDLEKIRIQREEIS